MCGASLRPKANVREAGVYEIRNTLDDKVYVGSSLNVRKRLSVHRGNLTRGKHHSAHLQAAWDKHGASNFTFRQLLACAPKDLVFYEQRLVDGYNAMDPAHGYNKRVVVQSNAGMKLSEEHKRKIAASVPRGEAHQYYGKRLSDAAYKAAADLKKKYGISAEARAKQSAALKGTKKPEGFGEKVRAARLGSHHTQESKRRMSAARTGVKQPKTHTENIGKLDYSKAAEIRALHSATAMRHHELAAMFGVSRRAIGSLLAGKSWV